MGIGNYRDVRKTDSDQALLEEIPKKFNEFERMVLAMRDEGISYNEIAQDLNMSYATLVNRGKTLKIEISQQVKAYYNNDLPVSSRRIGPILKKCVDKGYISPPRNFSELKKAFDKYGKPQKKGSKGNSMNLGRGMNRTVLKDLLAKDQEETTRINQALLAYLN